MKVGLRVYAALAVVGALLLGSAAFAANRVPTFAAYVVDPKGKALGVVTFVGVAGGTEFRVDVHDLPPGLHGMHIHEYGSCNPLVDTKGVSTPFGAARGHYDPTMSHMHLGPEGAGHYGDLPSLNVDAAGVGTTPFFIQRFSVEGANSIVGRSIVIHANPDNYTDTPPNGGSGSRIACGEIGPVRAE